MRVDVPEQHPQAALVGDADHLGRQGAAGRPVELGALVQDVLELVGLPEDLVLDLGAGTGRERDVVVEGVVARGMAALALELDQVRVALRGVPDGAEGRLDPFVEQDLQHLRGPLGAGSVVEGEGDDVGPLGDGGGGGRDPGAGHDLPAHAAHLAVGHAGVARAPQGPLDGRQPAGRDRRLALLHRLDGVDPVDEGDGVARLQIAGPHGGTPVEQEQGWVVVGVDGATGQGGEKGAVVRRDPGRAERVRQSGMGGPYPHQAPGHGDDDGGRRTRGQRGQDQPQQEDDAEARHPATAPQPAPAPEPASRPVALLIAALAIGGHQRDSVPLKRFMAA